MDRENIQTGSCIYIIKTSRRLYKIGKTENLQKRIASYHTHLPILFRVIRQYMTTNIADLEQALHVVFQHTTVKGEWFQLTNDELTICDNVARNYAFEKLQKKKNAYQNIQFKGNALLQVMEANEKYLNDYDRIAKDIKMGLSTHEIVDLYQGNVSKITIQTVRKILVQQTPNAEFISQWIFIVNDLEEGLTIKKIVEKYNGEVTRNTVQMVRRILKNQLY